MKKERISSLNQAELLTGVLLSAGLSSRMGEFKPLLPFGGQTLVEAILEQILQSRLSRIILVTGFRSEEIAKRLGRFAIHPKLRIIENPEYRKGISTSIRTGLDCIGADATGVMFLMGDQPLVTRQIINRLIRAFTTGSAWIVAPSFGKHRGNPVIFRSSLIPELRQLTGDTGGRELIRKYPEQVQLVPIRPCRVGWDVDNWDDYQKILALSPDPSFGSGSVPGAGETGPDRMETAVVGNGKKRQPGGFAASEPFFLKGAR